MKDPRSTNDIYLSCANKAGRGYLSLVLSYGYSVSKGEGPREYIPVKVSLGLTIDTKDWKKKYFTPEFMKKEKKQFAELSSTIEAKKKQLLTAYEGLIEENPEMIPTPDQIVERYSGKSKKKSQATRVVDWIATYAKDHCDGRTRQKIQTLATVFEAFEEARFHKPFKSMCRASGAMYLHTFSVDDWADFSKFFDVVAEIPRTFRKYGVEGLEYVTTARYNATTKNKYQSALTTVLAMAIQCDKNLKLGMDLAAAKKTARKSDVKERVEKNELAILINARMEHEGEERARKLFLILCMTGARYSDLKGIISRRVHDVTTDGFTFAAMNMVDLKTQTKITFPIFEPIRQILMDPDSLLSVNTTTRTREVMSNTTLNGHIHSIAKKLGLDRLIHVVDYKSDKTFTESEIPLFECISCHTGRRSFATMLRSLLCARELVAKACGHTLSKDSNSDLRYFSLRPEEAAAMLLKQIYHEHHSLPFALLSDDVLAQFDAQEKQRWQQQQLRVA